MKDTIFRAVIGMGIASASLMGVSGTAAYAQAVSQAELNEFADLSFKSNKTAGERLRYDILRAKIKANPPIEALESEDEVDIASTQSLKLPYLEVAPDFGITRLSAGIRYKDTFYSGQSDKADASGTAARVGLDVRLNIPINDNLEVFVGGWSFANFGGNTGLHNEEEEELNLGGSGGHYGILGFSVNNLITAYAGLSLPFYEHFCECFGPVQFSLNPYIGARIGTIDLDLDYQNGNGSDRASEKETYIAPLGGIEIKARSARVFDSHFSLAAAIGYQFQGGADATIKGQDSTINPETGTFDFEIENQQHFYGSIRAGFNF
ncbi:hypothetical protein [Pararhizobium sp. IMCC21322]|uniref:hypothetical protein n=1 Tax=Pararhizobium sp. IMCC21322 TaxID=3067903 RepID=UPI0027426B0B|nr:hypothetical protein [Pararhizobium sp. IMCC21322]